MTNKKYLFGFDMEAGKDYTAVYTPIKKEDKGRIIDSSILDTAVMSESENRLVDLGKCPYCTGDLEDKSVDCKYRFLFCKPCNKIFVTEWK